MSAKTSFAIEPQLEQLSTLQSQIEAIADQQNWAYDLVYQMELVLEEICINIIKHGEVPDHHPICVEIASDESEVKIVVSDKGIAFNPFADAPQPNRLTSIADSKIGGWGVHLVQTLTDETTYDRVGDKNRVTIVKRRKS